MELKSLCYKTDLFFLNFEDGIVDRGDYLLIETPSNPGFFWGNLLLFKNPPTPSDYPKWKTIFQTEFRHNPLVKHMTFAWDGTDGEVGEVNPFVAEGFIVEKSTVMTAVKVKHSKKYNTEVKVRPLIGDADWGQAFENQVRCRSAGFDTESYRNFKRKKMDQYRRMTEVGLGNWFGAFLGNKLVADLGIFKYEEYGRFQAVGTDPEFRRRGICGALIHQASEYAINKMEIETLVVVADPDDHPAKIYACLGFNESERAAGMYWRDSFITYGGS